MATDNLTQEVGRRALFLKRTKKIKWLDALAIAMDEIPPQDRIRVQKNLDMRFASTKKIANVKHRGAVYVQAEDQEEAYEVDVYYKDVLPQIEKAVKSIPGKFDYKHSDPKMTAMGHRKYIQYRVPTERDAENIGKAIMNLKLEKVESERDTEETYNERVQKRSSLRTASTKECPACHGKGVRPNRNARGIAPVNSTVTCKTCKGKGVMKQKKTALFSGPGALHQVVDKARVAAVKGGRPKTLVQYLVQDDVLVPYKHLKFVPKLGAGIYTVTYTPSGPAFEQQEMNTDELLRFEDPVHGQVLGEMDTFWSQKEKYVKKGFLHNRTVLMFGPPGSGKSCLVKLAMDDLIAKGDIIFVSSSIHTLINGLKSFREVEPERRCLAILEDVDELNEHSLLQLLDGTNTANNIMYLATTNYVERLSKRILRPGRIARKIEVPYPPPAGRKAYLQQKLRDEDVKEAEIETMVEATDGFSFGHLREFITAVYCMGQDKATVIERLKGSNLEMAPPPVPYPLKAEKKPYVGEDNEGFDPDDGDEACEAIAKTKAKSPRYITEDELLNGTLAKSASVKSTETVIKHRGAVYVEAITGKCACGGKILSMRDAPRPNGKPICAKCARKISGKSQKGPPTMKKFPKHNCMDEAVPYTSDGALGHGWECGVCGKFLQAG